VPVAELLQLLGLQCYLLANAQGENAQLRARIAELETALARRTSRSRKAE
jgi:BMFP domain-containing protein YqiC